MSRQYIVGLPVGITIDGDQVHVSVDMADFHQAIRESQDGFTVEEYTDEEVQADLNVLEAAYEAGTITAGVMHQESPAEPTPYVVKDDDLIRFLEQNELAADTITPEQLATLENGFAEHHAGGLFVLIRRVGERYLKLHDSWGDENMVVLHCYDPGSPDDPSEVEVYFKDGRTAVDAFLAWPLLAGGSHG